MSSELCLEKIIQPHLLTCPPETTLAEAAARMLEAHCSSILVRDETGIVGIWTEYDAIAIDDEAQYSEPVARFMSTPVKSLPQDTPLGEAAVQFRHQGVRHFLVTGPRGEPRGIISQSDIVAHQGVEYFIALREVHSINRRHHLVSASLPLADALRRMRSARLDALVVEYPDGEYGILTERDLVRRIGQRSQPDTAGELAGRPLVTVHADDSLFHARQQFIIHRIRHLAVLDGDGGILGLLSYADILANIELDYVQKLRDTLREREQALALSNHYLRLAAAAFESTHEGIMVTNAEQVIESVNPAFTQITGYYAHEVVGRKPSILSSGRHDAEFYATLHERLTADGHWQGEIWNRRRNGEVFAEWITINAVRDDPGRVSHYVAVFSDITQRKLAEERMRFLAYHDALTSLPNRALFIDRLGQAIAQARRSGTKAAVYFIDLDGFKPINDRHGRLAGDRLLCIVAQRLVECVRKVDTVARLSGDEFALVTPGLQHSGEAQAIATKLLAAVRQPVPLEGTLVEVRASLGISLYPGHGEDPERLLAAADEAMYAAKAAGRDSMRMAD